ncbi:MAG: TlpA family protein disulfide reductase [Candidatus Eremiobacteraeota bacterium]|nr:TlpA family protein disulfide reductase [Candidatus Eremiobacteraeota bacterium]
MRTLLVLAGAVVVIVLVIVLYPGGGPKRPDSAGAGGPSMLAGAPAASFTVARVDGSPDSLDRYRGKVVLVNLWATWCPPCREEMPALERLYRELGSRGLVVLGIDQGEAPAVASTFGKRIGITFPLLIDQDQQYGRAYAAQGLPTSVVVDRSGKIVTGVDGPMTPAQMRDAVLPLLRAK